MTGGGPPAPPPVLDRGTLARLRLLVEARTGLLLDERKDDALAAAAAELAARRGLSSAESALEECRRDPSAFDELVTRLTVGETHFFRNRPHFQALIEVVFPELLERHAARRSLRIWSAGCSTGEEVYSLAMALDLACVRSGQDLAGWRMELVGSDIDRSALEHARIAEYGRYSFRGVTPAEVERFFEPAGDRHRVRGKYRKLVDLRLHNLKTDAYPVPGTPFSEVDLIVCRNVTIYFSEQTTREVAGRFHDTLAERGYLLVGHSEHSLETYRRFRTRALPEVVLYQRGGDLPRRSPRAADLGLPELAARSPRPEAPPFAADLAAVPEPAAEVDGLEAASAALRRGDVDAAVTAAVAVLEADPSDADACLLLGQLAADRGHSAEAGIWLRRTLELRPLEVKAHYILALLAAGRGDRAEALRCLERTLYLEPDLVLGHALQARLLQEDGRLDAARRSLRTARAILDAQPDDREVALTDGLTAAQVRRALAGLRP